MEFGELAPELQEKLKQCKTTEEVLALATEQGEDLSEVELKAIAGGEWCEGVTGQGCWSQM